MLRSLSNSFLNSSFLRSEQPQQAQALQDSESQSEAPPSAPRSILKKRASQLFGSSLASNTPNRNVTFSESTTDFCPGPEPPRQRLFDDDQPPKFYQLNDAQQPEVIVDDVASFEEDSDVGACEPGSNHGLPQDSLGSYQYNVGASPSTNVAEWSNLLDASLGPAGQSATFSASISRIDELPSAQPEDQPSELQLSSLPMPKKNAFQHELQSSQTMTPGSAPRRLRAARRSSTTPVRAPSPSDQQYEHEPEDASMYHSAPREASTSFAGDESEFPDPESSPSHRGARRFSNSRNNFNRQEIQQQESLQPQQTQEIHSSPAPSSPDRSASQHHFGKFSLSTVMDDSPTHESERFSFSSIEDSQNNSFEDIRIDSPTPSRARHTPGHTETNNTSIQNQPEEDATAVLSAVASASTSSIAIRSSLDQKNSKAEDVALATDLESLLNAQSELIAAGQYQRSSLLTLIGKMQEHMQCQAKKMNALQAEKDEADAGWVQAIDQVEAWEKEHMSAPQSKDVKTHQEYLELAQRNKALEVQLAQAQDDARSAWENMDAQSEEFKLMSERVEWQEAEARAQMSKAKETESELKTRLEAQLAEQQEAMKQAAREAEEAKEVALREQAEDFNRRVEEAREAAQAEYEQQAAEAEQQHAQHLEEVLQNNTAAQDEELRSLSEHLDSVQSQLSAAEEAKRLLQANLDQETTHRQRAEEALQSSEAQRQSLAAELEQVQQQLAQVQTDAERSQQDHESIERECRFEIDSLRKRLTHAQDDLARAEEGATGQLDVLDRHQTRIAVLEDEIKQVNSQWHDEVQVLERQAKDYQKEIGSMQADNGDREALLISHKEEVDRLKSLVGHLRLQSADSDVKIARLQKAKHSLVADKESLEMALDAKQIEIDFLKRKKSYRASMAPSTTAANQTSIAVDLPSIQDTPLPVQQLGRRTMQSTIKREPVQPRRISFSKKTASENLAAAKETRRSISDATGKENNLAAKPAAQLAAGGWKHLKERKSLAELPSTAIPDRQPIPA